MTIPDPLRRSTPTPLAANLRIMGLMVRLETDSPALLECIRRELEPYECNRSSPHHFRWRLVNEPNTAGFGEPWPEMAGFSDVGLSLVNFGQRSFIAVDRGEREAVGFLEERFMTEQRFVRFLLNALIALTASSLEAAAGSTARVAPEMEVPMFVRQPGDA